MPSPCTCAPVGRVAAVGLGVLLCFFSVVGIAGAGGAVSLHRRHFWGNGVEFRPGLDWLARDAVARLVFATSLPLFAIALFRRPAVVAPALICAALGFLSLPVLWTDEAPDGPETVAQAFNFVIGTPSSSWPAYRTWEQSEAGMDLRGLALTLPAGLWALQCGFGWLPALAGAALGPLHAFAGLPGLPLSWRGAPLRDFLSGTLLWAAVLLPVLRLAIARKPAGSAAAPREDWRGDHGCRAASTRSSRSSSVRDVGRAPDDPALASSESLIDVLAPPSAASSARDASSGGSSPQSRAPAGAPLSAAAAKFHPGLWERAVGAVAHTGLALCNAALATAAGAATASAAFDKAPATRGAVAAAVGLCVAAVASLAAHASWLGRSTRHGDWGPVPRVLATHEPVACALLPCCASAILRRRARRHPVRTPHRTGRRDVDRATSVTLAVDPTPLLDGSRGAGADAALPGTPGPRAIGRPAAIPVPSLGWDSSPADRVTLTRFAHRHSFAASSPPPPPPMASTPPANPLRRLVAGLRSGGASASSAAAAAAAASSGDRSAAGTSTAASAGNPSSGSGGSGRGLGAQRAPGGRVEGWPTEREIDVASFQAAAAHAAAQAATWRVGGAGGAAHRRDRMATEESEDSAAPLGLRDLVARAAARATPLPGEEETVAQRAGTPGPGEGGPVAGAGGSTGTASAGEGDGVACRAAQSVGGGGSSFRADFWRGVEQAVVWMHRGMLAIALGSAALAAGVIVHAAAWNPHKYH